jgi:hypothetical protein
MTEELKVRHQVVQSFNIELETRTELKPQQ